MSKECKNCGERVTHQQRIDDPSGLILCEECYDSFVWICENCGRAFADSAIGGEEMPGSPPLLDAVWCMRCCEQNVAQCEECGDDTLETDMVASESGMLCERCASGYGPSNYDDSPTLSKDNWINSVIQAIAEFPDDLQSSIGHSMPSNDVTIVRIAGEPIYYDLEDVSETSITTVTIRYTHSMGESSAISIESKTDGRCRWLRPGESKVAELMQAIQLAILYEMWTGGAVSLISRNRKGHYVHEDGTKIFGWQ